MSVLISKDEVREPLYCLVPVQNVWRWRSRYKHAVRAIKHLMDAGAVVYLIEIAFNRREFVFTDSGLDGMPANCGVLGQDHRFRHRYIQLRSLSELWLKEASANIGVQHFPYDWQNGALIDADTQFVRPNVIGHTIQALQIFDFVQMFSHARDITSDYELMPQDFPHADGPGFVHFHTNQIYQVKGTVEQKVNEVVALDSLNINLATTGTIPYPPRVWPGIAWAFSKKAFEAVGGFQEHHIWGGADHVQAWCLLDKPENGLHAGLHPNYKAMVMAWADRCKRYIRRNIGSISGTVLHNFHGDKRRRAYARKHILLGEAGFDPIVHLRRDAQGLPILHDDGSEAYVILRDNLRQIAKSRDEDGTLTRLDLWSQGH